MLPLTDRELREMREVADLALPGTAVISTATAVSNGQGGFTSTWAASGTVACRLAFEEQRQGENVIGERVTEVTDFILTVPAFTAIDEKQRVEVDSVTYQIAEVLPWAVWEISRRVRVKEID